MTKRACVPMYVMSEELKRFSVLVNDMLTRGTWTSQADLCQGCPKIKLDLAAALYVRTLEIDVERINSRPCSV